MVVVWGRVGDGSMKAVVELVLIFETKGLVVAVAVGEMSVARVRAVVLAHGSVDLNPAVLTRVIDSFSDMTSPAGVRAARAAVKAVPSNCTLPLASARIVMQEAGIIVSDAEWASMEGVHTSILPMRLVSSC